jgi:plasmid replication initiation protein
MDEQKEPEAAPREVVPTNGDFTNQANQISRASYRMAPMLRRLIFLVMARVQAEGNEEMYVSMEVGDVVRALGINSDGGNVYQTIRDSVRGAFQQVLEIQREDGGWELYNWLDYASYNPTTDTLKIALARHLRPYVLQVQKQFTQLRITEFAKLQGRHSQRLYELLMAESGHAGKNGNRPGEWFLELEIPRLRKLFAVRETEYKQTNALRRRVIDPPAEEIHKNPELPISVKIEYLRKGSRLRAVKYHCKWLRREDPVPVNPATMTETQEQKLIEENPELWEQAEKLARSQGDLFSGKAGLKEMQIRGEAWKIFEGLLKKQKKGGKK